MPDPTHTDKHVVVVDDTPEIIDLFREIIEPLGHRMSATAYSAQGFDEVRKLGPDLCVLDLMIQGEPRGWDLIQNLRTNPETADIPVILCTADGRAVREHEAWLASNDIAIVLKPFKVDDLELAITRAFDHRAS